jgi:hypothetical protein
MPYNGLGLSLGNLPRVSEARSFSISAENPTGARGGGGRAEADPAGAARELGRGWKCRPCVDVGPGETLTIADIEGPGALQSMWWGGFLRRDFILRIYWDGQAQPSVECPLCDFFGAHWYGEGEFGSKGPLLTLNSLPVCVNPNRGLNCFWEMPFRSHCRMTLENLHPTEPRTTFHQINYTLTEVPEEAAYFHAQFRRVNPLPYGEVYTIVDGVRGVGHYVGVCMGWGVNNNNWWGEGEVKFYLDGDDEFPTICGTGVEDYFLGSYDWEVDGQYTTYSTAYSGMHQVLKPDGLYQSQHRHSLYRWHLMDPVRFRQDLRVTIQALGWRSGGRFLPMQDDICSVAYWYQLLPTAAFPTLPDRDYLEVI